MTVLNLKWLQHYYEPYSTDSLNRMLVFTTNAAEKHMLETEIKRREEEAHERNSTAI